MPSPGKNEKQGDFVKRCVPIVIKEGKEQKQAVAICNSMWSKAKGGKQLETGFLEWDNPVITGLALTNRPHIGNLDPISFVEENGKKLLKIPLMILGKWKHSTGVLNFTKEVIGKMIKGFEDFIVGRDLSLDNRHRPELGAMAWIKRFGLETREDGRQQFSAYGDPTPEGEKAVEERRYRYASLEFHPDWKSSLIAALSSDELEEYLEEEVIMKEEIVKVEGEINVELETKLEEQKAQHEAALKLEQEKRVALEERMAKLEARSRQQFVDNIVLKAEQYRDEEGRAHSKPLMDWARAILLEESIGEEDKAIQLEDRENVAKVRSYYRQAVGRLLEILPGTVPMNAADTEPDKKRKVELEEDEPTDEQVTGFWEA